MLRRLFASCPKRTPIRRRPPRARPAVELLEDRSAPAVWDGGGLSSSTLDPLNWDTDVVPTAQESMVFNGLSSKPASIDHDEIAVLMVEGGYQAVLTLAADLRVTESMSLDGDIVGSAT